MRDNAQNNPPVDDIPEEEQRDDTIIAKAVAASLVVIGCVAALVGLGVLGVYLAGFCEQDEAVAETAPVELPQVRELPTVEPPNIPLADVTESAGIDFVHENGAAGEKLLPETMGGGCAFFDYDTDGDQDILFVNSSDWPWNESAEPAATMALYANDKSGQFTNVTEQAGLAVSMYGQGCAVGDYDNDGDPDLFLSGCAYNENAADPDSQTTGPHRLFRNDDGRFTDVTTETAASGRPGDWGSSCGWFDYDNDGDLDLWICNYVVWSREFDLAQAFQLVGVGRAYGRPQNFPGTSSQLLRNDGDAGFTDVSEEAGIQVTNRLSGELMGKSLGLSFADFDGDGWLDVIVANDTVQNFLFHNQRDGTFQETAASAGVAFDINGAARGAMGVDAGCPRNGNDAFAVAIGNFSNEMTAFYVSFPGMLQFSDEAIANGLGPNTRLQLTFGVFFFDADLDGRLDFFAANGHLEEDIALVQASQTYEQSPQLFWNAGPESRTEFIPLTAKQCGVDFFEPLVGRGAAFADIDADGDLDVLIATTGARPRLLRNDQALDHHWLRLQLVGNGTTVNLDAVGARVDLHAGKERQTRFVARTRGYLSQSESIITFGLGDTQSIDRIDITWPDGSQQTIESPQIDQQHEIKQDS